ncbi:MAG: GFA family protein [Pacificimonas sp.]
MSHEGRCLCGAVRISVDEPLSTPDACHCIECRKQTGHFLASVDVPEDRLTIEGEDNVGWWASSEKVRRGFCKTCGSTLFWDPINHPRVAVAMGLFDLPTETSLGMHIWTSEKGDYYDIADGLPQNER